MSSLGRRWIGNSTANIAGGVVTALVNVLLPAIVVKHLDADAFAIWNLALQILVYVNLLGLGLQTAVARAVAHAMENVAQGSRGIIVTVRAAKSISKGAACVALFVVGLLTLIYPLLFPAVTPNLVISFRITLMLFGAAAIAQILAQVYMGVFQGLHRNVVFIGVQATVRVASVVAVWIGAIAGLPLVGLAALMALASVLLWPGMVSAFFRIVPGARLVKNALVDAESRKDLLKYCGTLSVWSISMLFVNSLGLVIVGHEDFSMAGPYAVAMTLISILVGLLNAGLSPLITTAAALYAVKGGKEQLPALLLKSTFGVALLLNLAFVALAVLYPWILRHWVGEKFVDSAGPVLLVLAAGHCLRNMAAPYSIMLIATGLHVRALLGAVAEAVVNLLVSLILSSHFGAMGVAWGTVAGSTVGLIVCLLINTRRTPELTPRPVQFVCVGFVLPLALSLPIYAVFGII